MPEFPTLRRRPRWVSLPKPASFPRPPLGRRDVARLWRHVRPNGTRLGSDESAFAVTGDRGAIYADGVKATQRGADAGYLYLYI